MKKTALLILDGWGHGKDASVSAIAQAQTPFVDGLYDTYPHAELVTYGDEVGLPEGQMGNSEVGHLNIGAGRVVYQELARINKEIKEDKLSSNQVLQEGIAYTENNGKKMHLLGLLSDGGVHSHINHLLALCDILKDKGFPVYIHAFLDGRDTDPNGGITYLKTLLDHIEGSNVRLASVIGRYYAMDRDNRWERVKLAYDLLVKGAGKSTSDILSEIQSNYDSDITDEFMPALLVDARGTITEDDSVLFYNFRTDRPRELTAVLSQTDMPEYDMKKLNLHYITKTTYDATFEGINVMYTKDTLKKTIGEVVADAGLTQLRIAETEKYPHVTFFFSGGREEAFEGEDRILIPSPKVATYDLQPEMSAREITSSLIEHVDKKAPNFICLNYANTDMVGHTGVFEAAIKSAETVDDCLAQAVPKLLEYDYDIFIIADHGNSDIMKNPDGSPHTAHTTNMVPVIYVSNDKNATINNGKLGDIAPTMLTAMGVDIPSEMDGINLVKK